MPVDVIAPIPIEKFECCPKFVPSEWVQLFPPGDTLQPCASQLPVHLVRIFESELDADREVVRGMTQARYDLTTWQPWHRYYLKNFHLIAEVLHGIDAALPGICDGCRACRHICGRPQELVELTACDLPNRPCDTPDLSEVASIEVTTEDHWGIPRPVFRCELGQILHDLCHLPHTNSCLRAIVGVFGQVRGDDDKRRRCPEPPL
mmetsp:Transcript_71583/g.180657  ORF Transcript_71583/g.180657 Transcript_71583/m.180657 type:complete len:205 (-) Transcript_71583:105-719(-)